MANAPAGTRPDSLKEAAATAIDWETYVVERYRGEIFGESLFGALAERASGDEQRKWRVLEQLERETRERIAPVRAEIERTTADDPVRRAEGRKLGEALASTPWLDLMASFRGELEKFVAEFERAEALAPPRGRNLARFITAHEEALLAFVVAEIEGRADPLEPVVALLRDASAT